MVRRLLALCHIVDDLVAVAEAEPAGRDATALLVEHAHRLRAVLRDTVIDLVANGHAHRPDAA